MTSLVRACGAVLLLLSGCVMNRPYETSGPSRSTTGVSAVIAKDSCGSKPDRFYVDDESYRFGLTVRVRVSNPTSDMVALRRDRMRLVLPDGTAVPATSWNTSAPVEVRPGQSKTADVRFVSTRPVDCRAELLLDPATSVTEAGRLVAMQPIRLVATR